MPRGAQPGERRGGRAKGQKNKASIARQKAVEASGATPLQVMLDNMRFAHSEAMGLVEKLAKIKDPDAETIVLFREVQRLRAISQDAAKDAAPYVHPKLTAVEHTTPLDRPFQSTVTHKLDKASAEIIANLIK